MELSVIDKVKLLLGNLFQKETPNHGVDKELASNNPNYLVTRRNNESLINGTWETCKFRGDELLVANVNNKTRVRDEQRAVSTTPNWVGSAWTEHDHLPGWDKGTCIEHMGPPLTWPTRAQRAKQAQSDRLSLDLVSIMALWKPSDQEVQWHLPLLETPPTLRSFSYFSLTSQFSLIYLNKTCFYFSSSHKSPCL